MGGKCANTKATATALAKPPESSPKRQRLGDRKGTASIFLMYSQWHTEPRIAHTRIGIDQDYTCVVYLQLYLEKNTEGELIH